ncbi:MAG: YfiR/HmsC family protein [Steroidobacteraceae bacterium]
MINFVTENRRLRFEISLPSDRAGHLEHSSRLADLAVRVEK